MSATIFGPWRLLTIFGTLGTLCASPPFAVRQSVVIAALVAALVPSLVQAKSIQSRHRGSAPEPVRDLGEAIATARSAWAQLEGRARLAIRQSMEADGMVEAAIGLEALGQLVIPGIQLPVALHDVPVLTARPATGELSSPFGVRQDPIRKRRRRFHKGLDFHGKRGQPVHAAGAGIVVRARRTRGYGRVVYIDHGLGLETRYAHLQRIEVKEGDFVPAGALVGKIGSSGRSTGPHLHFEVRRSGRAVDPHQAMDIDLSTSGWLDRILGELEPRANESEHARRKEPHSPRAPRSKRVRDLW